MFICVKWVVIEEAGLRVVEAVWSGLVGVGQVCRSGTAGAVN